MKNNYLIFFNRSVDDSIYFNCTKDELVGELINEQLIESEDEYNDVCWVVFENGVRIKG